LVEVSVELPMATVDDLIRRVNPDLRVSSGAAETLAERIQGRGAAVAADAAGRAREAGRKTIMAEDFAFRIDGVEEDDVELPIAPVDRIARLDVDDFRVGQQARLVLTAYLERWGERVAEGAGKLARHADRKTVQAEDVEAYFDVCGESVAPRL
jgi:histone H3/H4